MQSEEIFEEWLHKATDKTVHNQLLAMRGDKTAINNAFYKNLEFGTAGLRGTMGAGTNCLNVYTIIKTTQGVANCMKAHHNATACVTYDSRLNSPLFGRTVAQVLATNGIKCYITKECQPTPFLSYMVRQLHCDLGINITASHNPSQYNGYKIYDCKGCQLTDDDANEMTGYIEKVDPFGVQLEDFDQLLAQGRIEYTTVELEKQYLDAVMQQNLNAGDGISVVYTPLNGTGHIMVPKVLKTIGVNTISVVPEQSQPDGNFTTCPYPNPEKSEALAYALKLAEQQNSDIVIGTDPDCDRLGVAVRHNGKYQRLTGNEVGVLLCQYILQSLKERNALPDKAIVVKTIVSSTLADKVAEQYGAQVRDVLTGFKYIGNVIAELEEVGQSNRYVFGFEESCGYLKGTYVRDKDAVVAAMLVAEMTATYKKQGKTLVDILNELYDKFGTYEHLTVSYQFEGAEGAKKKDSLLNNIRRDGFESIAQSKVVDTCDYSTQTKYNLPKANVLKYNMANGSQLIIRPSGTEPLIKNYITVSGTKKENKKVLDAIGKQLDSIYKK